MTDAPVSPLRRRMIEDMTIRKLASRTQQGYIRAVKNFSVFFGASPDKASFEDVRRYQLHLVERGTSVPIINQALTALRFLFMATLRRPEVVAELPFIREPRKLPVVLSPEEVARFLEAAPGLKYRAALSVAYGAGSSGDTIRNNRRFRLQAGLAADNAGRCGQFGIVSPETACIIGRLSANTRHLPVIELSSLGA